MLATGIDLMRECIKALSQRIARLMGITRLSAWTPCGREAHPQRVAQRSLPQGGQASSEENRDKSAAKNIRLVTTGINGGRVNDALAEFEFSGDGTQALKCPAGHEPKSCCYLKKAGRG